MEASMSRPIAAERFPTPQRRPGFKIVCEQCGSLSIKITDPVNSPVATPVRCGRCGVIRGTLAELHDVARRSTFEF
jgi:hypothetical protein